MAHKNIARQCLRRWIVLLWAIASLAYVSSQVAQPGNHSLEYLTYWSLVVEAVLYIVGIGLEFCSEKFAVVPAVLTGPILATAVMVFFGSVMVSVEASTYVVEVLAENAMYSLGNMITHTIPFIFAIIYVSIYSSCSSGGIVTHLHDVAFFPITWIVGYSSRNDGTVQPKPEPWWIVRSMVVFYTACVPPIVWMATHTTSEQYKLEASPAMYLLFIMNLFGPPIAITAWARISWASQRSRKQQKKKKNKHTSPDR